MLLGALALLVRWRLFLVVTFLALDGLKDFVLMGDLLCTRAHEAIDLRLWLMELWGHVLRTAAGLVFSE